MILRLNKLLGPGCDKVFTMEQCGTDLESIKVVLGASVDVQVRSGLDSTENVGSDEEGSGLRRLIFRQLAFFMQISRRVG